MEAARIIQGRMRNFSIALGVAVVAIVVAASPASALTSSKMYSLSIAPAPPGTLSPPAITTSSDAVVPSGQSVQITAQITNETSTQTVGSANVFPPAGTTPVAARSFELPSLSSASLPLSFSPNSGSTTSSASYAANCTSMGTQVGQCVQLRNLNLLPGGTVTVTFSVATPACANPKSNWSWTAEIKQSNNFIGSPGNDFAYDGAGSQPTTELDGACVLAFVNQPHDAVVDTAITDGDWNNPSGDPVTVHVLANDGTTVVSGSTAPITMKLGANPGNATLAGTVTRPADGTAGTASFADLSLHQPAAGYTLVATSGTLGHFNTNGSFSLSSAPSDSFNIATTAAPCQQGPGSTCTTKTKGNGSNAAVTATVISGTGDLIESANASGTQISCTGYSGLDANTYTFFTTPELSASAVATTTITSPSNSLGTSANKVLKAVQECFFAKAQFITASGALAQPDTLADGTQGFIGLLPNCTGSTISPCIDRNRDFTTTDLSSPLGFDVTIVADIPAAFATDPAIHG